MEGPLTKKQTLGTSPKPTPASAVAVSASAVTVSGSAVTVSASAVTVSASGRGGVITVSRSGHNTPTDPSLAPVLGSGMSQLGMETGLGLYSSSEEWSSSDMEHELTVDM